MLIDILIARKRLRRYAVSVLANSLAVDAMSTADNIFSWWALRVGAGAKQVFIYRGSISCAEGRKIPYFTSEKADKRADTSHGGDVGKPQKARSRAIPVFFALDAAPPLLPRCPFSQAVLKC